MVDYPVENVIFMGGGIQALPDINFVKLKVKRIVLGSIEGHSGNMFFRGLLDSHPEILMMGYNYLNENLYFICIRLAMERKENILPLLWSLYNNESHYHGEDGWKEPRIKKFNQSMEELMTDREIFTSQELFNMIHIAYAKAWGKDIKNISDMIIYWEPHDMPREELEEYAVWLGRTEIPGNIIQVVRDICKQRGSELRDILRFGWYSGLTYGIYKYTWAYSDYRKKEYAGWERKVVKFESLKCNPQKELLDICNEWEIAWSDTLLETTKNGHKELYLDKITDFDLAPVYRTYEEYYSSFDRLRIMLINGPRQKKYGYPYVSSMDFSRRELQEMFQKDFRFEKELRYEWNDDRKKMKDRVKEMINWNLWKVRREEIMEEKHCYEKNSIYH